MWMGSSPSIDTKDYNENIKKLLENDGGFGIVYYCDFEGMSSCKEELVDIVLTEKEGEAKLEKNIKYFQNFHDIKDIDAFSNKQEYGTPYKLIDIDIDIELN